MHLLSKKSDRFFCHQIKINFDKEYMSLALTQEEILDRTWDAVVVGSGVGGATSAHHLAQQGKKVLLIEKGPSSSLPEELPLWSDTVCDINQRTAFRPFLGEGLGGSSRLYGMVMERLEDTDFQQKGGSWPLSLQDWIPYYKQAEELFQVKAVSVAEGFTPFLKHMRNQDINPQALHLSFTGRQDCGFCQSRLCEKNCKVDAQSGIISPDLKRGLYSVLLNTEVQKIIFDSSQANGVEVRLNHQRQFIKAQNIFLGLGALRTPYLLQKSKSASAPNGLGNSQGLLGKFLMRHFVDLYFLDWPGSSEIKNHKALGVYDFYQDKKTNSNLGVFQSFGSLPPIQYVIEELTNQSKWLTKVPGFNQVIKLAVNQIFSKHVMASIIEDKAHIDNRLIFSESPQVQFQYKILKEEQEKISRSREIAHKIFSPFLKRVQFVAEDNKRLAHACGTCKMGDSINDSVVNWDGRLHELENVYIVDSSVFPSSSGKNPSLTIAANAIRTVDRAS